MIFLCSRLFFFFNCGKIYTKFQSFLFFFGCIRSSLLHMGFLAFSSCGEWGLHFTAVRGLLIVVASLVVEHRL